MLFWILAGIGAYLLNLYFASGMLFARVGPLAYMGPRDDLPENGIYRARALKSATNFQENLPIFLVLGVLAFVVEGADQAMAVLGAQIFVLSRLVYMPIYIAGIPVVRSLVFSVGLIGLILMGYALF